MDTTMKVRTALTVAAGTLAGVALVTGTASAVTTSAPAAHVSHSRALTVAQEEAIFEEYATARAWQGVTAGLVANGVAALTGRREAGTARSTGAPVAVTLVLALTVAWPRSRGLPTGLQGLVERLLHHGGLVGDLEPLFEDRHGAGRVARLQQGHAEVIQTVGVGEAAGIGG